MTGSWAGETIDSAKRSAPVNSLNKLRNRRASCSRVPCSMTYVCPSSPMVRATSALSASVSIAATSEAPDSGSMAMPAPAPITISRASPVTPIIMGRAIAIASNGLSGVTRRAARSSRRGTTKASINA